MKNSIRFPHMFRAPIFADLPEDFSVQLVDECSVQIFDKPTQVLAQGDAIHGMYMIAHGSIEVTCVNPEGQSVLIHVMRQFEVFGEVEALAECPCAATCTAAANTTLLYCAKPMLYQSARSLVFLRNLMKMSYDRLVRGNTIKFVDQFYPVEQRLCAYLHRLSVDRVEISKTQGDLAGMLGCARQTLNRELGRLRDRAIIEIEKGKIRVTDRDALLVIASESEARSGNHVN